VGDVVATDKRSSQPVTVLLNGKPKYRGRLFADGDGRQKVCLAGEISSG
jgi:flagellar motor switch protein FliM